MALVTLVTPEPTQPDAQALLDGGPAAAPRSASGQGPKACPSCGGRFPADALFCSLDGAPLTTSPSVIAAAAASDPYLGREILGHIELRQLVGIGSMGRVYRAFQRGIDRDVAVKVLHRELSSNQTLVARFDREAKVASRLAHPNVVHVLLVGQLPDGAMYIVMEYLDGLSMQSALAAADGAMPLPRALHVALQLCDAAGEGHAQGIVHRDLKPENVMLVLRADDPDFVKVLDFGIARVHWGEPSMATAAGLIFGTARYISPEGAQGERVGPAGDVYSIATMLYQMLSGRTPFSAEQAVAVLVQQIHDPPPPLQSLERSAYVPEPIATVIMKNLSKKAADRAPDARAFGRALLEAAVTSGLSAQEVLARPSLLGGPRGSHPSAVQMPSMARTRQLQLEPETAARIGAVTAFETPAPGVVSAVSPAPPMASASPAPPAANGGGRPTMQTEISDPFAQPPGMATTRWSPPASLHARLAPSTGTAVGIDETMDDHHTPPPRSNTIPLAHSPQSLQPPQSTPTRPSPAPVSARDADTAPPQARLPEPPRSGSSPGSTRSSHTPTPVSRSASGVDATLAGDEGFAPAPPPANPSRQRLWRGALVGAVCFAVGAVGMIVVAWRVGPFGGAAPARPAVAANAHDGVFPLKATTPAAPEPTDGPPAMPPLDPFVRPRARAAGAAPSPANSAAAAAARAVIDTSNAKPGVGQPIDFEARIAGRPKKVDGALFLIGGPGIAAGTELPAPDDGTGVFRTTFTFLQSGRFDVVFSARADNGPVRGTRVVVVGDPPAASPPASSPPPAPADDPSRPPANANATGGANAKWL
jgi:serine/threonine-protein kinase